MPREGILFILVGPSGAGKNTLIRRIQEHLGDLPQLATATTRAMRAGEQEGREHIFVDRLTFEKMIADNALFEYQKVHLDDYYGTPRQSIENALDAGSDLIADIEFLGALALQAAYPENTVLVFVSPSNLDTLAERIRQRGKVTAEQLENRLARARFEMISALQCDYVVLNDIVEPAAEHLRQIVESERLRRRGVQGDLECAIEPPTLHGTVLALLHHGDRVLVHGDHSDLCFPSFPLADFQQPLLDLLRDGMRDILSQDIQAETISDERFSFAAPHHIAFASIPHHTYLYFYFKCTTSIEENIPEWDWRTISDTWPSWLRRLFDQ